LKIICWRSSLLHPCPVVDYPCQSVSCAKFSSFSFVSDTSCGTIKQLIIAIILICCSLLSPPAMGHRIRTLWYSILFSLRSRRFRMNPRSSLLGSDSSSEVVRTDATGDFGLLGQRSAMAETKRRNPMGSGVWIPNDLVKGTGSGLG
jgi:hypothetical protein